MQWSRNLHENRWMENCFLCETFVEQDSVSLEEHCYSCTNPECAMLYRFYVRYPSHKRKRGVLALLVTGRAERFREATHSFLIEEFLTNCPLCDLVLIERKDRIFRCPNKECGVDVEFLFDALPAPFIGLTTIMRIPESGFSQILSRNLDPKDFN